MGLGCYLIKVDAASGTPVSSCELNSQRSAAIPEPLGLLSVGMSNQEQDLKAIKYLLAIIGVGIGLAIMFLGPKLMS